MRARNIKPGFFKNYELAKIARPWGRILFEGLWCLADREGKLKDRPEEIQAEIFRYDHGCLPMSVDEMLNELSNGKDPFIKRYNVNGNNYIIILNFSDHQSPHPRESKSTIPDPEDTRKRKAKGIMGHIQGKTKNMPRNGPDRSEVNIESENGKVSENGDSENQRMGNNLFEVKLSRLLFEKIRGRDPKAKEPNWNNWERDMRLLINVDGRDPVEVKEIIIWCQKDPFWQNNILSPHKLREQFTQLKLKMEVSLKKNDSIFKPQPGIQAALEDHRKEKEREQSGI